MKIIQNKNYSTELTALYLDNKKPIYSLSPEPIVKYQYDQENKKYTDNIQHYVAWFLQEGCEPFSVKFLEPITLPRQLTQVTFDTLEACEVRYNVYFRAKNVREVV